MGVQSNIIFKKMGLKHPFSLISGHLTNRTFRHFSNFAFGLLRALGSKNMVILPHLGGQAFGDIPFWLILTLWGPYNIVLEAKNCPKLTKIHPKFVFFCKNSMFFGTFKPFFGINTTFMDRVFWGDPHGPFETLFTWFYSPQIDQNSPLIFPFLQKFVIFGTFKPLFGTNTPF